MEQMLKRILAQNVPVDIKASVMQRVGNTAVSLKELCIGYELIYYTGVQENYCFCYGVSAAKYSQS